MIYDQIDLEIHKILRTTVISQTWDLVTKQLSTSLWYTTRTIVQHTIIIQIWEQLRNSIIRE